VHIQHLLEINFNPDKFDSELDMKKQRRINFLKHQLETSFPDSPTIPQTVVHSSVGNHENASIELARNSAGVH